ncbi:MAG TPA: hypothetical protein VE860_22235 [Chthoniobacterales bacterium]|nr:hypothetical protein [Chthoniobacterales bacterium]
MAINFQPLIDDLRAIIETSRTGRLSQADEQKGASLFKELVELGGKPLSNALELLGDLPWFVPVNGTLEAWPQLTPAKKRSFLTALKPLESEASRRMRLSIARGLYKVDPSSSLKLLVATLQALRTDAGLQPKDRQIFYSVLIGKNKPWLLQLDLKSLKPAEAALIALTAIESAAGSPPPAAVAVFQWAKPFQPLKTIPEPLQQELGKALKKWSLRWQKQLAEEDLPPALSEILQVKLAKSEGEPAAAALPETAVQTPAQDSSESTHQNQPERHRTEHPHAQSRAGRGDENRHDRQTRRKAGKAPVQHPKTSSPDINELLKEIQIRFSELRNELQSARNQLRQSQQAPKQEGGGAFEQGKEVGKLREENARLNETVASLRQTLGELANDNFEKAVSRRADSSEPMTDPVEQFKSLLTLRVREQIVNFKALNRENHVDGLPLLLDNILRTLQENGIDLENLQIPPPEVRRKY